jgi:catechol 2,3-dioxygenase-like lactoylglutathione lyase family enzyme
MDKNKEFRVALTVDDFDKCVSFYRDVIGLSVIQEWPSAEGKGILFSIEKATLEILDQRHAEWVDYMEVGRRLSGPVRFALNMPNMRSVLSSAEAAGARIIGGPVQTPWKDVNARLIGPDGTQITFFGRDATSSD